MKKITAFLTALIMAAGAVSCGSKKPDELPENAQQLSIPSTSYSTERLCNMAYKRIPMELPEGLRFAFYLAPFSGGERFMLLGTKENDFAAWTADSDLTKFEKLTVDEMDPGASYTICVTDDGSLVTFVVVADYGDLPEPDFSSPDYDRELYESSATYSCMIKRYSPDGKLASAAEVDEKFDVEPSQYMSIGEVSCDGKFVVVDIDGAYELFDLDGKYYGSLSGENIKMTAIGNDRSGNIVCAVDAGDDNIMMCRLGEDGKLIEADVCYKVIGSIQGSIQQGTGDYELFFRTNNSIYGIRSDDGQIESLFDTQSSGVKSTEFRGFALGSDGKMMVLSSDFSTSSLDKFIERDPEEIANMPVLTIGYCSGSDNDTTYFSDRFISSWNRDNSHDFRVQLKTYKYGAEVVDDGNGIAITGFDDLAEDVIKGELPDVLFLDDGGKFGNLNIVDMGGVCDLYEFMDGDKKFSRDYFLPDALRGFEYNGELPAICRRVSINVGSVIKKKFVPSLADWSVEKELELTIDPPIEKELSVTDSRVGRAMENVIYGLSFKDWIDFEKGTCDFKSSSFIRFLEYCNEAPVAEFDYSNYSYYPDDLPESEYQNWEKAQRIKAGRRFIDDTELFGITLSIGSYDNYVNTFRGEYGGDELTFLDEPTFAPAMQGLMAINKNSEQKELAWDYIKSWFTTDRYMDENYRDDRGWRQSAGFPVTKAGFEYDKDFYCNKNYFDMSEMPGVKDDPKWKGYEGLVYVVDYEDYSQNIQLGKVNASDIKGFESLIATAKPIDYSVKVDTTDGKYRTIAQEELLRYFNGGCTAEQCADAMQSRISIYLSEKYSN